MLTLDLRRTKGNNGRLQLRLEMAVRWNGPVPESKDPEKVLCRLWGVDRIITGKERDFTLDNQAGVQPQEETKECL